MNRLILGLSLGLSLAAPIWAQSPDAAGFQPRRTPPPREAANFSRQATQPVPAKGFWDVSADTAPRHSLGLTKPYQVPLLKDVRVHFCQVPSKFALFTIDGGFERGCAVFDLELKQTVGTIKDKSFSREGDFAVLSPDGRFVVDMERNKDLAFRVWNAKDGTAAKRISLADRQVQQFAFVDGTRMAVVLRSPQPALVLVDVNSGEFMATYQPPTHEPIAEGSLVISPGGKLAAFGQGEGTLRIVDLTSMEMAGEITVQWGNGFSNLIGIDFSPQGTRLAAIWKVNDRRNCLVWEVASGDLVSTSSQAWTDGPLGGFRRPEPRDEERLVQWLPDGLRLLVQGIDVIDAKTGEAAGKINTPSSGGFLVLDTGEVLVTQLRFAESGLMSIARISAPTAPDMAKDGAKSATTSLPPPILGDLSAIADKESPATSIPWTAVIAPSTPVELPLPPTLGIGSAGANISAAIFSRGSSPWLVFSEHLGEQTTLGILDLATGKKTQGSKVSALVQLVDVSRDGRMAVTRLVETSNLPGAPGFMLPSFVRESRFDRDSPSWARPTARRLDVWLPSQRRHGVGWVPYKDESFRGDDLVTYAGFHGTRHVMTTNLSGTLVRWRLPKCEAEYRLPDFGRFLGSANDGSILFGWCPETDVIRLVQADNGDCLGELQMGRPIQMVHFATIPAGQAEFLAIIEGTETEVLAWDLATGKIKFRTVINPEWYLTARLTPALSRLDAEHVLLGNRWVLDVRSGALVWEYEMPRGYGLFDPPDGRVWQAVETGNASAMQIRGVRLPRPEELSQMTSAKSDSMFLFGPGDPLKVVVDVSVPGSDEDAGELVRSALENSGNPIRDDSPFELAIRGAQRDTGERTEYRAMFAGFKEQREFIVDERVIELQITLTKSGTEIWKAQPVLRQNLPHFVNGDPQTIADESLQASFTGFLRKRPLPVRVYPPATELKIGRSNPF